MSLLWYQVGIVSVINGRITWICWVVFCVGSRASFNINLQRFLTTLSSTEQLCSSPCWNSDLQTDWALCLVVCLHLVTFSQYSSLKAWIFMLLNKGANHRSKTMYRATKLSVFVIEFIVEVKTKSWVKPAMQWTQVNL